MQRKFEISKCHKENLTDFSYCLLFNCLREWNENTYEFGGKKKRKFGLFKEKITQKFDH